MVSRLQKIDLSGGELSVSERRETILQEAVAALQRDGIVCLKRAIPRESVEKLNIKMQADLDAVAVSYTHLTLPTILLV